MRIQAETVNRDSEGIWHHSQCLDWGKDHAPKAIHKWFSDHGLFFQVVYLEHDPDAVKKGQTLVDWQPVAPRSDAFLLSIFEADEGPAAVWAVHVDHVRAEMH